MSEHKDITGQEMIAIAHAINSGGFSLRSLMAVESHLERDHNDLFDRNTALQVERARHQAAILKGRITPDDLIPQQNFQPDSLIKVLTQISSQIS